MNVKYSKCLRQGFIVGPTELTKLNELLQNHFDRVKIYTDCADDFSRPFATVDDLINYENPKSKEIYGIRFMAESSDYSKSATIFLASVSKGGMSIELVEEEEVASRLGAQILDILTGMRSWYNIFVRIDFTNLSFYMSLSCLWILSLVLSVSGRLKFEEEKSFAMITPLFVPYGFWFVCIAVLFLNGNEIRDVFFPPAVFKIGQGKSRFEDKEWIRRGVAIGLPVSLVAGLIIWLITLSS